MAAKCLLAYRRAENSEDALVGALLEAESFDDQKVVARFCIALAKAMKR